MEQGEDDKLQPVLELVLKADEDEREVFVSLGLDKLNDSDELFQKYFGYHRDLYSSLGIDSKHWDRIHGSDNQFSGTCKGFALFLTGINEDQLDKVSETLLGKIREELQRSNQTLTSIRTIMLSPTKRLPTTTFPIEDNTMRLQQGNKVYSISMDLISEESDIIDCIRGDVKETIDTHQKFYQDANKELVGTVEREYRQEIQRVKDRYRNAAMFPLWITKSAIIDHNVICYHGGEDQIVFILPFRYNLTMLQRNETSYTLIDRYQEHRNVKLLIAIQNQKFAWADMVENDLERTPNFHGMGGSLCLGSYRYPDHEIETIVDLIKIRDDIQGVMQTANYDSLGTSIIWNDNMRTINEYMHDGNLGDIVTETPAYVHRVDD
jgi:hypothetical protein